MLNFTTLTVIKNLYAAFTMMQIQVFFFFHEMGSTERDPLVQKFYQFRESELPSFFFCSSSFEWTDKASRNSKKVVKEKSGKKPEQCDERDIKKRHCYSILFLFIFSIFSFLMFTHSLSLYKKKYVQYWLILKGEKKRDSLSLSLFTPILVERQHFIPQVPKKQPSVCYPTQHYWLSFFSLFSFSANCKLQQPFVFNPTLSSPKHPIRTFYCVTMEEK